MSELNYDCLLEVLAFLDRPALSKCLSVSREFHKAAVKTLKEQKLVLVKLNVLDSQDVIYVGHPRNPKIRKRHDFSFGGYQDYAKLLEDGKYLPEFVTIDKLTVGGRGWETDKLALYGQRQGDLSERRFADVVKILGLNCAKDITVIDLKFDRHLTKIELKILDLAEELLLKELTVRWSFCRTGLIRYGDISAEIKAFDKLFEALDDTKINLYIDGNYTVNESLEWFDLTNVQVAVYTLHDENRVAQSNPNALIQLIDELEERPYECFYEWTVNSNTTSDAWSHLFDALRNRYNFRDEELDGHPIEECQFEEDGWKITIQMSCEECQSISVQCEIGDFDMSDDDMSD